MKIAIYGYGNLGKGVECAVNSAPDAELFGVFTRRAPESVKTVSGVTVYHADDILKYIDAKKWDVYFLGYPNTTVEEKTKVILEKDDKNDWTKKKTFDELCFKIKNLIEISKTIEAECKKNNIRFVNTSINFDKQLRAISDLYK